MAWYVSTFTFCCPTLTNGIGTGYYYNRFRPGLGTVLIFLTLLTSLLQHVVHRITYKSELERVRKFMLLARKAAWGPQLKRNEAPRKVKVGVCFFMCKRRVIDGMNLLG
jgi:hypothetical protein